MSFLAGAWGFCFSFRGIAVKHSAWRELTGPMSVYLTDVTVLWRLSCNASYTFPTQSLYSWRRDFSKMLCQCLVMHDPGHPQGSAMSHSPTEIMQWAMVCAWPRLESFPKIYKRRAILEKGNPVHTRQVFAAAPESTLQWVDLAFVTWKVCVNRLQPNLPYSYVGSLVLKGQITKY